jgi:hypothetical protein
MGSVGDNPIQADHPDDLGRAAVAAMFMEQMIETDASAGLVFAVLGPWGSGKTSFINRGRPYLDDHSAAVVDFNPWLFSGADQLVDSFFIEMASQLRLKHGQMAGLAGDIENYGESFSGLGWLPVVGPWVERTRGVAKVLTKLLARRKEGISERRQLLSDHLAALDQPIVVIVDDIDRLSTDEIRDIFKLVRLTASFPNIVYLLAFDRDRVENALSEQGINGRDYLEKILQLALDLPQIPDDVLLQQLGAAIGQSLEGIEETGPFDENAWPDILMEIVHPLVRNMRDVNRYSLAVRGTVRGLDGKVALADVLGLEAIRVFLPDVFRQVTRCVAGLTTTSVIGLSHREEPPHLKAAVDQLIKVAAERGRGEVGNSLIQRLFPAAQRHTGGSHYGSEWQKQWLRARRVAHESILRLYLERIEGPHLQAFNKAELAYALIPDREGLDQFLRGLPSDEIENVIGALETYEGEFPTEGIVPAGIVLLNLLASIPTRQRGMYELDTRIVVGRVVYRLIRQLEGDPVEVEMATREILAEVDSLSSQYELVTDVGYREGAGHRLATEEGAASLERAWRDRVRAASIDQLVSEWSLLRVFLGATREIPPEEDPFEIPDDPRLMHALLRSSRGDAMSNAIGTRAVHRSPRLAWEALISIFGDDEDRLRDRVSKAETMFRDEDPEIYDLAKRYAQGWRPERF